MRNVTNFLCVWRSPGWRKRGKGRSLGNFRGLGRSSQGSRNSLRKSTHHWSHRCSGGYLSRATTFQRKWNHQWRGQRTFEETTSRVWACIRIFLDDAGWRTPTQRRGRSNGWLAYRERLHKDFLCQGSFWTKWHLRRRQFIWGTREIFWGCQGRWW